MKIPNILVCVLVILSLVECGNGTDTEEPASGTNFGGFKVALLLPGKVDDQSWNSSGYLGLRLVEKELAATVAYSENVPESAFEQEFEKYARQGFDLIIGHGGQFAESAERVAQKFPRVNFMIVGTHPGNNSNMGAVQFRQEQIGYLAGAVAGLKTESNKAAYIMGMDYNHMRKKADFFQRGALAVNPETVIRAVLLGLWEYPAKGKRCAQRLIEEGFDVIAVDANSSGTPIHQIAQEAGIYTLGWTTDQYDLAPRAVVTSAIQRTDILILQGARQARLGRWEGKQYKFGITDDVQDLAPFRDSLSPGEKEKIQKIRSDILHGKIDLLFAAKVEIVPCGP